jgi:hypothetical protein
MIQFIVDYRSISLSKRHVSGIVPTFVVREQIHRLVYTSSCGKGKRKPRKKYLSRLASSKVARVQAAVADCMLLAQPCEEALETETVAAVRRGAVPFVKVSNVFLNF